MAKPKGHEVGCYWFNQGSCMLYTLPEDMVYSILARVPLARQSLVGCGLKCPEVDTTMLKFAKNPKTMIEDDTDINDKDMAHITRYKDYHRYAVANSTLPKDTSSKGESE